jgi:hypothetical protein
LLDMLSRSSVSLRPLGLSLLFVLLGAAPAGTRGPVPPSLLSGLVWRNLGPFRAGRVAAVSGAIGQPGVYYIGLPLGGVWKTTSAGETWTPIFDSITEASSVGAVEVAPSDPNVIYAGMGDLITGGGINEGNGVYKSNDAGRTWQHTGLDDTKQIPSILVDPKDPNLVLLAAAESRTTQLQAALDRAQQALGQQLAVGEARREEAQRDLQRMRDQLAAAERRAPSQGLIDSLRRSVAAAETQAASLDAKMRAIRATDFAGMAQQNQGAVGLITVALGGDR